VSTSAERWARFERRHLARWDDEAGRFRVRRVAGERARLLTDVEMGDRSDALALAYDEMPSEDTRPGDGSLRAAR
jgi:hypothetical protein